VFVLCAISAGLIRSLQSVQTHHVATRHWNSLPRSHHASSKTASFAACEAVESLQIDGAAKQVCTISPHIHLMTATEVGCGCLQSGDICTSAPA